MNWLRRVFTSPGPISLDRYEGLKRAFAAGNADKVLLQPGERFDRLDDYRIAKLELKPGDVLVVKCDGYLTQEVAAKIRDMVEERCPGIKAMVLDRDIDLAVLTREDIESRTHKPTITSEA